MGRPITIKPPEGCKPGEIKKDITMLGDKTTVVLTYPSGFTIKTVIQGDEQLITPSGELIDLGNGIYQVPN